MLHLYDIRLSIEQDEACLPQKTAELLGISESEIKHFRVVRKSLDARRERPPEFNYIVEFTCAREQEVLKKVSDRIKIRPVETEHSPLPARTGLKIERRPIIIGCGPAGLFSALTLAEGGTPPILLDRGKRVEDRIKDIQAFWLDGILNTESNVHFGEGGAGTFSDGKLTTRIKNTKIDFVRQTLVDLGAPSEILVDAKPHIGTDRLRRVLVNMRGRLLDLGCEIRFEAKVTDILIRKNRVEGVVVNKRDEIGTNHLILAAGQSCADTLKMLNARGVSLAPKAFALGARVEHPQELINHIQYGKWWKHKELPPAEYALTAKSKNQGRSVYTFCMCPGGQVIGCSSEAGTVVTNGMSHFSRNGEFANSAVVVNIGVEDFDSSSPLAGLHFRRIWEERAFAAAGRNYFAPVQKMTDFLDAGDISEIGRASFMPGIKAVPMDQVLPGFITAALREGLREFERKMPGFVTGEAVLIGVETRTSSPVRILRDDRGMSVNTLGLYPCGEGSGYAGGIMSSAVDGIRAAEFLLNSLAVQSSVL